MNLIQKIKNWWSKPPFERIEIQHEVVDDVCALARSTRKEMVAFFTGEIKGKTLLVDGLYLKSYDASETSTSFMTHDLPMTGVVGTVHSHPSSNTQPSNADLQLFSKLGWFHAIIGRPYTRDTITYYDKRGGNITVIMI